MDHLENAQRWMEASEDAWLDGDSRIAAANAQFAIAHTLIALVERLGAMTTDGLDGQRALNVMAGLVKFEL